MDMSTIHLGLKSQLHVKLLRQQPEDIWGL